MGVLNVQRCKNMKNGEASLKKLYEIYNVNRSSRQSEINK